MKNKLDEINAWKRTEVEQKKAVVPFEQLMGAAFDSPQPLDFAETISNKDDYPIHCIAEIKKASPSKGVIVKDLAVEKTAREYKQGGASAISVLTDEKYFQGNNDFVMAAKNSSHMPILRKDFIIDEYQIYEARKIGADAVLLIAASLTNHELRSFLSTASDLFLSTLVECHSKEEIERAVDAGASIIGINNRNLQTFEVDVNLSLNLKRFIPNTCITVSESGIKNYNTVARLEQAGFDAVLVGEHLMVQGDKTAALRQLLGRQ
jgi:indole-3-glycerol phosphate synthase